MRYVFGRFFCDGLSVPVPPGYIKDDIQDGPVCDLVMGQIIKGYFRTIDMPMSDLYHKRLPPYSDYYQPAAITYHYRKCFPWLCGGVPYSHPKYGGQENVLEIAPYGRPKLKTDGKCKDISRFFSTLYNNESNNSIFSFPIANLKRIVKANTLSHTEKTLSAEKSTPGDKPYFP